MSLNMFQQAIAVPAYPHPIQYKQPDGSIISLQLKGDERVNWAVSPDGFTLLVNKSGFYEYAKIDASGDLVLSGIRYNNVEERTPEEKSFQKTIQTNLQFSAEQKNLLWQAWEVKGRENLKALKERQTAVTGTVKAPLILVGFQGKPFTKSKENFEMLLNQPNYTANGTITGSVRDYFYDNSYGQLTFQVDVYGPYTLSRSIANYDDASWGDPRAMAYEAANLAHNDGCDFSKYDMNGDGEVDALHIIFAGYGQDAGAPVGNSIWSHSWALFDEYTLFLDGVQVFRYSCSPELRGISGSNITYIGVIVHEMSHVFGVPDFYDTDYSWSGGLSVHLGPWDVMASGSWNDNGRTPPNHTAWSKDFLGWVPTAELTSEAAITLPNPLSQGASYKINTTTANEYFLLENRQKQGWDSYIPSSGLLIYHVDENYNGWDYNCINCDPSHRGLYVKQAGGGINCNNNTDRTSDPYPNAGNDRFTDTSVPNSQSWAKKNTNAPVTKITQNTSDRTVSFIFMENPDYYDARLSRFVGLPSSSYYTGEKDIQVEMRNNGRIFTSAIINWSIDGVEQTAYQWTGSLLYDGSQIVTIGKADLAIGTHTITATVTIANDVDDTNNTISTTIEIKSPETLPYSTEFNGSLDGWESISMVGNIDWEWSNERSFKDPYYDHEYLEIKTTTRENGYAIYNLIQNVINLYDPVQGALVSPVFDFSDVENAIDFSFSHTAMAYEMPTTLKNQASTDNFKSQIVDVWSSPLSSWNPVSGTVTTDLSNFAGESNVKVRFLYTGGIAFGWAVDDIKIVVNNEPRLKTLTVSEGQLSPEFNGAQSNYNVVVLNEIDNITIEATSVRPSDNVTGTGVKSLNEGNNVFQITVSNADNSAQKVYTVTVKRLGQALRVPFTEDFETGALSWTQVNGTQANQWHIGTATAATGQYSAYISNDGGATNSYTDNYGISYLYCDVYFTPHTNPANVYELDFDWKGVGESGYDYLNIYLIEPDVEPVAREYLYPYLFDYRLYQQSTSWQKMTINLSDHVNNLQGKAKRLVFMWKNDDSVNGPPPIAIDNVSIRSVDLNEAKLASLTVSNGKLSPDFSSGTYNYTVIVPNEVNSITLNASPKRSVDIVSGTGVKSLNEGNNTFEIMVSNPENSVQRIYKVTVKRLGPALNVPFMEDFETGASHWTQVNGAQVNQWHIGTATSASGQYSAYISNDGGATNSYTDNRSISYLYSDVYFTPHTNPSNIYELSFDWKSVGESCCDNLYVYLTEPDVEPVAGEYLYSYLFDYRLYQQSTEWQKAKINLSYNSYNLHSGDVKRLVFMWINDSSVNGPPPIAIDNVSIRSVDPNEAKLASLTVSSGVLSPYFSSETFEYTVAVRNEVSNITLNASPMRSVDTVSGTGTKNLNEGDNVFEIVVSNPDKTVQNIYKVTVKRLPPMFEVPFTETFEEANRNWLFANEGQTNQWHIGTATAASGTHSAYISKDGGISNSSSSTSSISYMSCLVYFTPPVNYDYSGYYQISLDWKGNSDWSVSMYLTDVDYEPKAGQPFGYGSYLGSIGGSSTWKNFMKDLSSWYYLGETRRLVFMWNNDYGVTQPPIAIDNLSIEHVFTNDATLKNLTVNPGSLTSAFDSNQFDYTVNVGSNVDKIRIDAVPNNRYATVIGANKEFNLNTGSNTFNILVVAENGYHQNTYSVRVNRGATGIDNPTVETLKVYPNPTQGMVYVENADGQEIELYNSLGKLLERTEESSIDLSVYPKGVYLLRVGENTVKVVKQ